LWSFHFWSSPPRAEFFEKRTDFQIAAEKGVPVADLLRVVDILEAVGFTEPELMQPAGLTVRFKE